MSIAEANAAVVAAQKRIGTSEDVSFHGNVKEFLIRASCNTGSRHPVIAAALKDLVAAVKAQQ